MDWINAVAIAAGIGAMIASLVAFSFQNRRRQRELQEHIADALESEELRRRLQELIKSEDDDQVRLYLEGLRWELQTLRPGTNLSLSSPDRQPEEWTVPPTLSGRVMVIRTGVGKILFVPLDTDDKRFFLHSIDQVEGALIADRLHELRHKSGQLDSSSVS